MAMAEPMIAHLQNSKRVVTASAKTQVSANSKLDPIRVLSIEGRLKEACNVPFVYPNYGSS